jgi:hypothetical protein
MPSDWNASTVTGNFYWTGTGGGGNVVWGLQGRAYGDNEAIDATWSVRATVTDAFQTANALHISGATGALTLPTGPAASDLVQYRCYRDSTGAADTYNLDARLIGIMVNFGRA